MDKLGRNYALYIEVVTPSIKNARQAQYAVQIGADAYDFLNTSQYTIPEENTLVIKPPFTLEFDVKRNFWGTSNNTAEVRIYNLSENNRNLCRFDVDNYGEFRRVVLQAGYGDQLSTIFIGNLQEGYSQREGTNFITTLSFLDGGYNFQNSIINQTFENGLSLNQIFIQMIQSMPGISVGAIGNYPEVNIRSSAYAGYTTALLNELSLGGFFIDKAKAHVLNPDEAIESNDVVVVSAQTGLLNTPRLSATFLHFDMIFEPRIDVGRLILLEALTDKKFNRFWKVAEVQHRGVISEAVCGDVITTVSCVYEPEIKSIPEESAQ